MKGQILSRKQALNVAAGVLLFIGGGLAVPALTSKADPTASPQDCQTGYHSVENISPTGNNTYDCAQDATPTAPAATTTPAALPITPSATTTPAPPSCP